MKLKSLLRCEIYRDGGSLEAIWRMNTGDDYAVALLVGDWDCPGDRVTYFLFNCRLDSIIPHSRIDRGSREHRQMLQLIESWLQESGTAPGEIQDENNRLDLFMETLRLGDY